MEKEEREKRCHVLVLTYPSQGHINPLLQFAKRLLSKGVKATLVTTHYAARSICAQGVGVETISDGFDDGGFTQAPSAEAYVESFRTVGSRTLGELVLKLQEMGSPVGCIVYDSFLPWALDVARERGIFGASFFTNSASVCSIYWRVHRGLMALPDLTGAVPVSIPGLPPLGSSELPSFLAAPTSYPAYLSAIFDQLTNLDKNDWAFGNTFEELESEVAKAMTGLWPVTMLGPMVPSAYIDKRIKEDTGYGGSLWKPNSDEYMKWLGRRAPNSVVYVSFGSMAGVIAEQMEEVAWGLRESDQHFLWVVKELEQGKLPDGFVKSIQEIGLIVNWCDQLEVLSHQAVGCFVTHCGWNSTLEGLSLRVPMVGVPQWSDQPTNAKCVEDVWGVGVRAKSDDKGIVRREELKTCIREVMEGERSLVIKRNAIKWRELAKEAINEGGSSDKKIDEFVERLLNVKSN
ncbi:UDP-glycosyltransferase 74B1-like [Telopea speciosissima]|uniref:UDP-glycosyltransferase 74B1-like n=1 Tax=Telopea speciosissima TaxID=54955 RepID=UPI001CC4E545|nr:UDP-glycosyltransferase 74B1-like [Telopea speciosissima]